MDPKQRASSARAAKRQQAPLQEPRGGDAPQDVPQGPDTRLAASSGAAAALASLLPSASADFAGRQAGAGEVAAAARAPSPAAPDDLSAIKYQLFTASGRPLPPCSRARLQAAAQLLESAAATRPPLPPPGPAPPAPLLARARAHESDRDDGTGDARGSQAADPMEMSQPPNSGGGGGGSQGWQPGLSQDPMDMSQLPAPALQPLQQSQAIGEAPPSVDGGGGDDAAGCGGGGCDGGARNAPGPPQPPAPPPSPSHLLPEYASWPLMTVHTLDGAKVAFVAPSMVDKVVRENGLAPAAPKRRNPGEDRGAAGRAAAAAEASEGASAGKAAGGSGASADGVRAPGPRGSRSARRGQEAAAAEAGDGSGAGAGRVRRSCRGRGQGQG